MKENGFIVYIPVYAIKGPVYLENKNKEVLYCGRLGPVWQRGLVTKREAFVKVRGGNCCKVHLAIYQPTS